MRNRFFYISIVLLAGIVCFSQVLAGGKKEIQKTFEPKENVKIKLILGGCTLKKSNDQKIHVQVVHSYDEEDFEVQFREKSSSLSIREKLHGNNNGGYSKWLIELPDKTEVDFESATGELNISNLILEIDGSSGTGEIEVTDAKGKFELSSGTGQIRVENCEGEFDLSSGTGRVVLEQVTGTIEASSGTGRVKVQNIELVEEGDFSSGTGDVEVSHVSGDDFDLSLSSGTGDATMILDGLTAEGYFEFRANAYSGDIDAPFEFDKEEEYPDGDSEYIKKSFTRGSKSRRYYISTGTGTAELKR